MTTKSILLDKVISDTYFGQEHTLFLPPSCKYLQIVKIVKNYIKIMTIFVLYMLLLAVLLSSVD